MIWFPGFLLISVAMVGLAIGAVFGRQPLKASCGELSNLDPGAECDLCGANQRKRQELGGKV